MHCGVLGDFAPAGKIEEHAGGSGGHGRGRDLAARNLPGYTFIAPGEEARVLAHCSSMLCPGS